MQSIKRESVRTSDTTGGSPCMRKRGEAQGRDSPLACSSPLREASEYNKPELFRLFGIPSQHPIDEEHERMADLRSKGWPIYVEFPDETELERDIDLSGLNRDLFKSCRDALSARCSPELGSTKKIRLDEICSHCNGTGKSLSVGVIPGEYNNEGLANERNERKTKTKNTTNSRTKPNGKNTMGTSVRETSDFQLNDKLQGMAKGRQLDASNSGRHSMAINLSAKGYTGITIDLRRQSKVPSSNYVQVWETGDNTPKSGHGTWITIID